MDRNGRFGKVSIITPLYNGERFVAQTIQSVVAQTYTDWEMIIVNDGSTDSSAAVVASFVEADSRIIYVEQANAGSSAARNNGIRRATGRYIALLDADDLWDPDFLDDQLAFMHSKGALLVYSSHRRVDQYGKECLVPFVVPERIEYRDLLRTCYISCLTGVYDTSKYGKIYLNAEFKSLRDDYIYWLDIIKKTGCAYGNRHILSSYRITSAQATHNKFKMIKPQFKVYYQVEKLGLVRSLYYLCHWAVNGVLKYCK